MSARPLLRTSCTALLCTCLLGGCKFLSNAKVAAEGIYFGYFIPSSGASPVAIYGGIKPNQYAYFGGANGTLYVLPDTIRNELFTGKVPAYAPLGEMFNDGRTKHSFDLSGQGTATNRTVDNITGTLTGDTGGGSFTLAYKSLSTSTTSLTGLAGTYQGYYWGNSIAVNVTISANGSFTVNDGFGCSGSGTLSIDPNYNLIQANVTLTGNSVCPGAVSGLGFSDTQDLANLFQNASGTYIYLGLSGQSSGVVTELYKS